MFTGLVETKGQVEKVILSDMGAKILFSADFLDAKEIKVGDSIALNGVCLSVISINLPYFQADIMKETLNLTNLAFLKKGDEINLERAMKINSRLDGHIVSGHIDTTAKIKSIENDGFSKKIKILCNTDLIIYKGSIAINGVSLTVSKVEYDFFEVSLIPETIKNTNLKNLKIGDIVNIEYDIFAKYIKKFISKNEKKEITLEFLKENGF